MRVIAGKAGSVPLVTPSGKETRPTTDKIKETLFNIIQQDIPGCVFIDCFAGSGAIGIEALSRGAEKAVFIDHGKEAFECITKNLEKTRLADNAVVIRSEMLSAVPKIKANISDDTDTVYFLDPPYDQGLEYPLMRVLAQEGLIRGCDIVIIEKSLNGETMEELSMLCSELSLTIYREKCYKNQRHIFIRKA